MKTWVMLIIALMLSSWPINMAQADDSSMNSEANVTIRQGSFDYNESSPYAMPGVAGTFIQSYTEIRDDANRITSYNVCYTKLLRIFFNNRRVGVMIFNS